MKKEEVLCKIQTVMNAKLNKDKETAWKKLPRSSEAKSTRENL